MSHKPEPSSQQGHHISRAFLRFSIGILFALEASLALVYYVLKIPESKFAFIAIVMGVSVVFSLALVYAAFERGWISQIPRLDWTMFGGYSFSMIIVVTVIAIITSRVFTNTLDAWLTAMLLFFGSGIFLSFGYALTHSITSRLKLLHTASRGIAGGNLQERVPVSGQDEIAELSATFNAMAAQLQDLDAHQKELRRVRNDLFAWAGHDLRTPLTSIRAMLEALSDQVVDDPITRQRYLQIARKEIDYLSRLIDDLFDLARMDADGLKLDLQPVSLGDLISDTLGWFHTLAVQNRIDLSGSVQTGVDLVYADAQLLNRVLSNLTSNALRFTPPGGRVVISAERAAGKILVMVRDNGEGIRAEDLPFIFERFYRGEKSRNRSTGGSGLGLAISRGIIEAHHERIFANSAPGEGTTISFTLQENSPKR